jgi:hypothetical protein
MVEPLPPLARSLIFPVLLLLLFASSLLVRLLFCSPENEQETGSHNQVALERTTRRCVSQGLGQFDGTAPPIAPSGTRRLPSPFRAG